jgi:phosphoribosylformylglycinamidine synthase
LAKRRDVEATAVGVFTDTGFIDACYGDLLVAHISEAFLHNGLPTMALRAVWTEPDTGDALIPSADLEKLFLKVLADPNVRSKEDLVRQYDHEVQAGSVVKPFTGVASNGPSDGAIFRPVYDCDKGITVTHGVCPRYGDHDAYRMAACAVDEAYRAHIACGGDPEEASVLDNFCWPDPVTSETTPDGEYKLAQLVRACKGLRDTCLAYGLPLISGKDSMKNDARIGGTKISVRPTLLISLMGSIIDIHRAITTDFKEPGDVIFLLGTTRGELGGTIIERIAEKPCGDAPDVHADEALAGYRTLNECIHHGLVRSCHDLSDGGLAVTLAESCIGGGTGAAVDLRAVPAAPGIDDPATLLFCETPSRLLFSVHPSDCEAVERLFRDAMASEQTDIGVARIGEVKDSKTIVIDHGQKSIVTIGMGDSLNAWRGAIPSYAATGDTW